MSGTSEGRLLAGKVLYRQLTSGHRTGFEPVLLAAALPARAGETVLELGTGAGAALLCLGHRVPGIFGVGVEIAPELAALAAGNFSANGFRGLAAVQADAAALPFGPMFDHVFANPPWHDPAGTASPDPRRVLAHQAGPNLLGAWIAAMAAAAKPDGSLTLILPAALLGAATAEFNAKGWRTLTVLPLLPRLGRPAKQIILQARRGDAAGISIPGLILHDDQGITRQANAVLRDGAALLSAK